MNIIVISDTHMPKRAKTLPEFLVAYLKTADLIIHAGDLQTNDIYQQLLKYAPVEGVIGNVDEEELVTILPFKKIIEINGVRIGITHGHGKGKTTEKRVLSVFEGENVDIIIFGHSHIPLKKEVDGKILFNPGSPTDKRKQERYSFGRIQIGVNFTIEHIFFDK
jgi:uncharacterized protein